MSVLFLFSISFHFFPFPFTLWFFSLGQSEVHLILYKQKKNQTRHDKKAVAEKREIQTLTLSTISTMTVLPRDCKPCLCIPVAGLFLCNPPLVGGGARSATLNLSPLHKNMLDITIITQHQQFLENVGQRILFKYLHRRKARRIHCWYCRG